MIIILSLVLYIAIVSCILYVTYIRDKRSKLEKACSLQRVTTATISALQQDVHEVATNHGWWPSTDENIPEKLALVHSEISEALEGYRNRLKKDESGWMGEELADAVIRIMDLCEYCGINLEHEIVRKNEINKHRSYRHGGKRC